MNALVVVESPSGIYRLQNLLARNRQVVVTRGGASDGQHGERRGESTSGRSSEQHHWLTYEAAAKYMGWTVTYLRNLVSAGLIPVYGRPRSRRFRADMLDLFLTNPDAAMRKFRLERSSQHDG